MNTPLPPMNPNTNTPPTPADNLPPEDFNAINTTAPPMAEGSPQLNTNPPQPETLTPPPTATTVSPASATTPTKSLPSPRWFWYGLSAVTWIVGVVLAVIYLSRSDKVSKRFGWFSLMWSFLLLLVLTGIILFKYYVLDPPT